MPVILPVKSRIIENDQSISRSIVSMVVFNASNCETYQNVFKNNILTTEFENLNNMLESTEFDLNLAMEEFKTNLLI